jgi:hypothetical protein
LSLTASSGAEAVKRVQADDGAVQADIPAPAHGGGLLDCDRRGDGRRRNLIR